MSNSAEVHVFATVVSQPGEVDTVRAALVELVAATRAEPGNLEYRRHEDPKHPGHFYFFEVYADQAAADAHRKSPHLAAAFAKVGARVASAPVITETEQIAGQAASHQAAIAGNSGAARCLLDGRHANPSPPRHVCRLGGDAPGLLRP